jgi:23S rRNA pseudouridine2605 synthase
MPRKPSSFKSDDADAESGIRLQKFLAMAGYGARRQCEELITTGRVTVDGLPVTELGARVDPSQDVRLDGERVKPERRVYWVVNKPPGVVCTNNDPEGRPKAVDLIPKSRERLFTVGRLDEHSQGLLLITNDGELANRLAHPRFKVAKIYRVQVQGNPTRDILKNLCKGVFFPEGKFKAADARMHKMRENSAIIDITLMEGQNREIRRMLAKLGHKVQKLTRISLGDLNLGDMPVGTYRPLTSGELAALQAMTSGKARHTTSRSAAPRGTTARGGSRKKADKSTHRQRQTGEAK